MTLSNLKSIVLFGASGHAKVIASSAKLNGYLVEKCYVKDIKITDNFFSNILKEDDLDVFTTKKAIIGIGNNKIRFDISIKYQNIKWISVVHPTAYVDETAEIGKGVFVGPHAVIQANTKIGDHVIINSGAIIEHDCIIKEFSHIAPNATLCGNVTILRGCFIGAGSTIIPMTCVNDWIVVGAGSVVTKNLLDSHSIYKGVPAVSGNKGEN